MENQRENEVCASDRVITRYYLSITCCKYFGAEAGRAFKRDKAILQKPVLPLRSDIAFEDTVCSTEQL